MVANASPPTIWGLTPLQVHDRFWAAQGVQVVRRGEPSELVEGGELFLLTDARSLVVFNLASLLDVLRWNAPDLLWIRLVDRREAGYREHVMVGPGSRFQGFRRSYGAADHQLARVCVTRDRELARVWQNASDSRSGWRLLRRHVRRVDRDVRSRPGSVYDRSADHDLMALTRKLVQVWRRPDSTIRRAVHADAAAWADTDAEVSKSVRYVGPVWIGAGRRITQETSVVGPSVLWDAPEARPRVETIEWDNIEPTDSFTRPLQKRSRSSFSAAVKRMFDLSFAAVVLLITLPLYPLVMLAIWLEDGRPFFFAHYRETRGGREFPCIKFRSMRKDAEEIKQRLREENQSDGPQFFMKHDPRLTLVGRFIRATNIDELPQFINVLLGHMSVVGPRPSPRAENQCCPAWREARLSVRPGVTGLWQVNRTRRPGMDFQEWIRYDIEYVETSSWRLDFAIIWQTLQLVIRGGTGRES
jgi:lipopolysaccharide/colanic/teichoic acid biosynthesis glycosyltransferase